METTNRAQLNWSLLVTVGLLAGLMLGMVEYLLGADMSHVLYVYSLNMLAGFLLALFFGIGLRALALPLASRLRAPRLWAQWGAILATVAALLWFIVGYIVNRRFLRSELDTPESLTFNALFTLAIGILVLAAWRVAYKRSLKRSDSAGKGRLIDTLAALLLIMAAYGFGTSVNWSAVGGYDFGGAPRGATADGPPIVVILIDTLRADHLSVYGYERPTSPNLEALAADGVLFHQGYASSPWTVPSLATLFTGLYPTTHNITGTSSRLPRDLETLAEMLADEGYNTAAFIANQITNPKYGYGQGFRHYYPKPDPFWFNRRKTAIENVYYRLTRDYNYYRGSVINRRAFEWLEKNAGEPFFLYLHYMEPHDPYEPPVESMRAIFGEWDGPRAADIPRGEAAENPTPELIEEMVSLYDGEVHYSDVLVGEVFERLKGLGVYEDALIWIVADHGEEFYEHQKWGHKNALYQESLRIPYIVKLPGNASAGTERWDYAELVDLKASVADLVGAEPESRNQGKNVLNREDVRDVENAAYGYHPPAHYSIRREGWTFIRKEDGPAVVVELYNHQTDSDELNNVAEEFPQVVERLDAELEQWVEETAQAALEAEEVEMDAAREEALRTMGYWE